MRLSGWGQQPEVETRILPWRNPEDAARLVRRHTRLIPRGNGRAYGDAALSAAAVLQGLAGNRILELDLSQGRLRCEAGLLLSDLLAVIIPRGWFVAATPGTRHVTLGGMLAADVHGKNHHRDGGFADSVTDCTVVIADGSTVTISPTCHPDLFHATCGGMGLTGVIVELSCRLSPLPTAGILQQTLVTDSLEATLDLFTQQGHWPYSVAWIDCLARGPRLGRSVLFLGRHATLEEVPPHRQNLQLSTPLRRERLAVPFHPPCWILNRWSLAAFNALYHAHGRRQGTEPVVVPLDGFFYPLDTLSHWNRLYGRRGFTQYQCVLPLEEARRGLRCLLDRTARAGLGSFLAVLKQLGPASGGMLSFPRSGYTLALDFPWTRAALDLLNELDVIVRDHGGRLYLAKDARMTAEMFQAGYPHLDQFREIKARVDPHNRFQSLQSARLGL
ncbi:MAG: FAD-binding oxidoreductase [Magnetococcus sp. WYHC-3]